MADADGTGPDGTVLIFRLGSLGDTIVILLCHAVERAFPRHRRLVLTNMLVSIGAPVCGELVHCRTDAATGGEQPEAEHLARCLAPLGVIDLADRAQWDLRLSAAEQAAADAALGSLKRRAFIAINLGGKVGIFGHGNQPRKWHPYGRPTRSPMTCAGSALSPPRGSSRPSSRSSVKRQFNERHARHASTKRLPHPDRTRRPRPRLAV